MRGKFIHFFLLIFLTTIILSGCFGPGPADYAFDLPGEYHLVRNSAHNVLIIPKRSYQPSVDLFIPSKVVEVAFDDRYILAKRFGLVRDSSKPPEYIHEIPDASKLYYYIFDTSIPKLYETTDLDEFNHLRKELSIPETLMLKDPKSYK